MPTFVYVTLHRKTLSKRQKRVVFVHENAVVRLSKKKKQRGRERKIVVAFRYHNNALQHNTKKRMAGAVFQRVNGVFSHFLVSTLEKHPLSLPIHAALMISCRLWKDG